MKHKSNVTLLLTPFSLIYVTKQSLELLWFFVFFFLLEIDCSIRFTRGLWFSLYGLSFVLLGWQLNGDIFFHKNNNNIMIISYAIF